jgi:hypothetical protein
MKSVLKSLLVLTLGLGLASSPAQAQVRVNVNIGPPAWGPAVGPNIEYYYIPEIDGYYDLYSQQYVFLNNGYWVSSPYLPPVYAGYDPRYFHPIVIDYRGRQPWGYIGNHRAYYSSRYGGVPGRYLGPGRGYYDNRRPVIVTRPNPGYGRGYDNRNGYVDNRGYDRRDGYNDNRGRDNRNGYGDNRGDNRGGYGDNRSNDNRSNDNRGGDNRGGYDSQRNDNGGNGRGEDRSRGRIR